MPDHERILVVDDDGDIRELLRDRLEFMNHEVLTARDGEEGFARIEVDRPDLVLLDIQMPRLDGFGVLERVRAKQLDVPIIIMTANGTVERAVQAMRIGAQDFLMKPLAFDDVEKRLGRALRESRLRRENARLQNELIHRMEMELQAAHDMQMELIPDRAPTIEGYDIAGICIPAREVGGDYFTYIDRLGCGEDGLGVFLADVSGKGMSAAIVAVRLNEMLIHAASGPLEGERVVRHLDEALRARTRPEMFATCAVVVLHPGDGLATLTSAGNPEIYRYDASRKRVCGLGVTGFPLGLPFIPPGDHPFRTETVALGQDDVVVLTSDGIEEAQNESGDFFGADRLARIVEEGGRSKRSAAWMRDAVVEAVARFTGNGAQTDDITVVVIRHTGDSG